ncbi:MAG: hypothetical protein VB036_03685 [Propionicimonas sp.]|nr:hypothetical protein [Propionicimonas sp.]
MTYENHRGEHLGRSGVRQPGHQRSLRRSGHASLADPLPDGVTVAGTTLTWRLPDLAPGAVATITYAVRVDTTIQFTGGASVTIHDVVVPVPSPQRPSKPTDHCPR